MGSKSKSRAMIRILFVLHFKIISDLLLCLKREKELPIAEIRLIGLKKESKTDFGSKYMENNFDSQHRDSFTKEY